MTKGTRAARVKVIFTLPKRFSASQGGGPTPIWWPQEPLAYVEWYTRFTREADPTHLMYVLSKPAIRADGLPQGAVIPVSQIRQSCQLIPTIPHGPKSTVPDEWTTDTVLDVAMRFYLNNWASLYSYQTLW